MMKKKIFPTRYLLIVVLLTSILLFTGTALNAGIVSGETIETDNGDVDFKFVQGYFVEMKFTGPQEPSLELTHVGGSSYDWEYSTEEGWTGDTDYLDKTNTTFSEEDEGWTFTAAVDHGATTGDEWSLEIDENIYEARVVEADTGLGKSGSLNFALDPHTEGATATDSLDLVNDGNVPGMFELNYDHVDNLEAEKESGVVEAGTSEKINFTYQYDTTEPGAIEVDQFTIQTYSSGRLDLDAEGNVIVESDTQYAETPSVSVGYEDLELDERGEFSFQYHDSVEVEGDSEGKATFHIFPEDEVSYDLESDALYYSEEDDISVTILGTEDSPDLMEEIDFDPEEPLSGEYNEVELTVEFRTDREDDGYLELFVEDESFITNVNVDPVQIDPPGDDDDQDDDEGIMDEHGQTLYFGAAIVGVVVLYGAARSRLGKESEDDNKKKKKKKRGNNNE